MKTAAEIIGEELPTWADIRQGGMPSLQRLHGEGQRIIKALEAAGYHVRRAREPGKADIPGDVARLIELYGQSQKSGRGIEQQIADQRESKSIAMRLGTDLLCNVAEIAVSLKRIADHMAKP